jgi:hypothetical protein
MTVLSLIPHEKMGVEVVTGDDGAMTGVVVVVVVVAAGTGAGVDAGIDDDGAGAEGSRRAGEREVKMVVLMMTATTTTIGMIKMIVVVGAHLLATIRGRREKAQQKKTDSVRELLIMMMMTTTTVLLMMLMTVKGEKRTAGVVEGAGDETKSGNTGKPEDKRVDKKIGKSARVMGEVVMGEKEVRDGVLSIAGPEGNLVVLGDVAAAAAVAVAAAVVVAAAAAGNVDTAEEMWTGEGIRSCHSGRGPSRGDHLRRLFQS